MPHKYDSIVPHVIAALTAAAKVGVEVRVLAKGGIQSLLVAHYLGHELSHEGQGYDAHDADGSRYEYKATNPTKPQCTYIFSKSGTVDVAIEKKIGMLDGVVFAVIGPYGVARCHIAGARAFKAYVTAHFDRVKREVASGAGRRGRPRAEGTDESRSLCLTEDVFLTIADVKANVPRALL